MDEFKKYLRKVINRAGQEAQQDSSNTVEAQHLLLAIAAQPEPTTRSLLTEAGLDLEAIRAALDQEFERSLSAVGVSRARYHLPRPSPRPQRAALGRSAKLAVERGVGEETRMRELHPAHLLLGVLAAEVGTVPRALDIAGIDREQLISRVRQALAA